MEEIWKIIPGFKFNMASNMGRIKSLNKLIKHKNGNSYLRKGKILNPWLSKSGYPKVCLTFPCGERKSLFVHRLVALAFIPNPENKPQVNHKDKVLTNSTLSNLEWVTAKENMIHAFKDGNNRKIETYQKHSIKISVKNIKSMEVLNFNSFGDFARYAEVDISTISKAYKFNYKVLKKFEILK